MNEVEESALDERTREILAFVRTVTGHDLSGYKAGTIRRRVSARADARRLPGLDAYLRHLQRDPAEVDFLLRSLLIGVTSFFRDPAAFEALRKQLDALVSSKQNGDVLRGWIAGSSTGEEAYSIAILLRECMQRRKRSLDVKLFATDLNADAVDLARRGLYPPGIADEMDARRLRDAFTWEGNAYRVRREVRELVVFASHDITTDPPFLRLDLVSCRNVLIYFDAELQKRALKSFHYAVRPGGLLFLGSSESPTDGLFAPLDKRNRLFRRQDASAALALGNATAVPRERTRRARATRLAPAIERAFAPDAGGELTETHQSLLEELMSTNDELVATNQTLLTLNEQLDASKEERRSLNAQVQSTNRDLERKIEELTRANDDLNNLLRYSCMALVFLDRGLRIRRFTEQMRSVIRFLPDDHGRPFHDFEARFGGAGIADLAARVLETLEPKEIELRTEDERRYSARIEPYRTTENAIEGVVLAFDEIRAAEYGPRPSFADATATNAMPPKVFQ